MIRFRLACSIVLLCSPIALGQFTFVHVSDSHIGAGHNAQVDEAMFKEIAQLSPKPAFVINTGDVCENGTIEQFDLYQKMLPDLGDIRGYVAPGNHDVRWNPLGKEGFTLGAKQPLYQSWDWDKLHFVLLDSTVLLEHWGHISQEQLDWLAGDLKKVGPDKPVIIGFHHWIARDPVMVDNERALLDVVAPYNVVLWLQGHGHANIHWSIEGAPATMVGALYNGSYDIIHVTSDELQIEQVTHAIKKTKPDRGTTKPQDKEQPGDENARPQSIPPAVLKPLMTIPLARRTNPQWSVKLASQEHGWKIIAESGELPPGAKMAFRLDRGKLQPMPESSGECWTIALASNSIEPGTHVVLVQATLPDQCAYQKWLSFEVPGRIAEKWEANVGGAVQSRLVRAGKLLYVSTMANDLVALDAATGKEVFRVRTEGSIFSQPHVEDGTVYFGSADHHVYAVDAATGEQKWKTKLGGAVLAGPNEAKGIVCVGCADTKIYGMDAGSGSIIWTAKGQNLYQSATATDGEHFFVGSWDNHFRCIDAGSGSIAWDIVLGRKTKAANFSPYAPAITSPAVGDGKVYVSTDDGILHALNISDGSEAWKIDWKRMGYSSPLFKDGKVYCALDDKGKTFCADAATGKILWTCDTGLVIYDSSFRAGGGEVFIGNVNGTLNAINAQTGKLDYQYSLGPGHLLASPAADENCVYIANMSGKVVALPVHAGNASSTRPAVSQAPAPAQLPPVR